MSQLGPGVMTFEFHCDCTYQAKVWVLFQKIRENGAYWVEEGRISMTRATGVITTWPYRFEEGRLLLEEYEGEVHAYERQADRECE